LALLTVVVAVAVLFALFVSAVVAVAVAVFVIVAVDSGPVTFRVTNSCADAPIAILPRLAVSVVPSKLNEPCDTVAYP
jgi:hypothetical protein